MELSYARCNLCARNCGIDRTCGELGFCKMADNAVIARAALHMWEEPIISGSCGSGAIFFSGCSLGCVFCQNRKISRGEFGKSVTAERLSEIMLELKENGAHNINLVTPTHFAPTIKSAIILAKNQGFDLPIVYNTSAYDNVGTIRAFEGLIDIYLPDMKYYLPKTAKELSMAESYPLAARLAIAEMVRQQPTPIIENGIMRSGVIVRLLLLPSHTAEAKLILKYLHDTYGDNIYVSLMNQYTPMENMKPPLNRRVTRAEYNDLIYYAQRIGVRFGFTQQFGTAKESFIPDFDNTGV